MAAQHLVWKYVILDTQRYSQILEYGSGIMDLGEWHFEYYFILFL